MKALSADSRAPHDGRTILIFPKARALHSLVGAALCREARFSTVQERSRRLPHVIRNQESDDARGYFNPPESGARRIPFLALIATAYVLLASTSVSPATDVDLAAFLVPVEERKELRDQINERLRSIRESGCPVNLDELHAYYLYPESERENAAFLYERAFEEMDIGSEDRDNPNLPVFGTADTPGPGKSFTPEQRKAIAAFLEKNHEALRLLGEATELPTTRFNIDLREGHEAIWDSPYLRGMQQAGRILHLQALLAVEENEPEMAMESVWALSRLAHALFNGPDISTYLSGTAMSGLTAFSVIKMIEASDLTLEEISHVETILDEIPPRETLYQALCRERALNIQLFRIAAYRAADYPDWLDGGRTVSDRFINTSLQTYHRISGHWLRDFLAYLDTMEDFIAVAEVPAHERPNTREWERLPRRWDYGLSDQYYLISALLIPSSAILETDIRANHLRLNAVRLALRAEAWRLKEGKYPDSLERLLEADETMIAHNWLTDEPFQYTITPNGFSIDIGEDRIDPIEVVRPSSAN